MLNWGICCCGKICHDFALAIVEADDKNNKLVSVAARNLSRAKGFADSFNMKNAYGSYEELAKCNEIEIVYIGSVNSEHCHQIEMFLNHGKHVLVEKPMCTNVADTERVIELARKRGLFLMEAVWSRCLPAYHRIRELVADGKLGPIKQANASFQVPLPFLSDINVKEIGGSGLLDIGIYTLQFVLLAFPNREVINIKSHLKRLPNGVDTAGQISLEFEGGGMAFVDYTTEANGNKSASIYGENGEILLPKYFWTCDEIIFNDKLESFQLQRKEPNSFNYNYPRSWYLMYEARHVADCIDKGMKESDVHPLSESMKLAKIMETALMQSE